jgi:hypothetical protein
VWRLEPNILRMLSAARGETPNIRWQNAGILNLAWRRCHTLTTLFPADRLVFFFCSTDGVVSVRVRDGGKLAMECTRCGGPMMLETVIKLRRTFVGFRETRSRGAYCATCKIGVPMEDHQSVIHQPTSFIARSRKSLRRFLPTWRHARVSRSGCCDADAIPLVDPLSLAR